MKKTNSKNILGDIPLRPDAELLDFLETWGGGITIRDDVLMITVPRSSSGPIDKKTGMYSKFTVEIPDRCLVCADPKTKKIKTGTLREALSVAMEFHAELNVPVSVETVLKDLQEYADERHKADELRIEEDPEDAKKPWIFGDEKEILEVKKLFEQGKYAAARERAYKTDTFVREGFPDSFRRFLHQKGLAQ